MSFPLLLISIAAGAALLPPPPEEPEKPVQSPNTVARRLLVIPLHRLQFVQRKRPTAWWESPNPNQYEVREFVDILHQAEQDPMIQGIWGSFGITANLSNTGWADLEEIRNAIVRFRLHCCEPPKQEEASTPPKELIAYADTFNRMNHKEYYLASAFTNTLMQEHGVINLFGMASQHMFFGKCLEWLGIKAHVFKHGQYKNAPNMYTEAGLTMAHRENQTSILQDIHEDICDEITQSRYHTLVSMASPEDDRHSNWKNTKSLWGKFLDSGTFTAEQALNEGLIDCIAKRDPLPQIISEVPSISLNAYAQVLAQRKTNEQREKQRKRRNTWLWSLIGFKQSAKDVQDAKDEKEEIALLHVEGGIDNGTARRFVNLIRDIRQHEDTKAVIVRVTSPGGDVDACETMLQELKALNRPVLFSFGNMSASGGYYIATAADRIFASKKTITGSIGIFGVRLDFTELAKFLGVNVEHVTVGNLAAMDDPYYPMNDSIQKTFAAMIDRGYEQFKQVVAEGRNLEDVESVGQGRVWTGKQAKENGLVDEIGGLNAAIDYARRKHTTEKAQVVVWPREVGIWEGLWETVRDEPAKLFAGLPGVRAEDSSLELLTNVHTLFKHLAKSPSGIPGTLFYTCDEITAMKLLLGAAADDMTNEDVFGLPDEFWG